jgi:hypothetical protein
VYKQAASGRFFFIFKHQSKRLANPYIFPALSLRQKKTLIKLGKAFFLLMTRARLAAAIRPVFCPGNLFVPTWCTPGEKPS